jgi:hypothetical protein
MGDTDFKFDEIDCRVYTSIQHALDLYFSTTQQTPYHLFYVDR